jgi:hypothetical protein
VAARPRPMFGRRRRPLVGRVIGVVLAVLLVPSVLAASSFEAWPGLPVASADVEPEPAEEALTETQPAEVAVDPDAEPAAGTPAFATVEGLTLHLPAEEVVLVGFHEASSRDAQAFGPIGRLQDHQNTTKFDPPADVEDGPAYVVLSSRGRPYPATSAIDVLLERDEPVRSPVTGTVTDVRGYHLYGKHPDQRIELAPADAPDQRIVMIHLDGVSVSIGDEVVAGETAVAAAARVFPFGSHIDRYTEPDRYGHVHYEVKRATAD